MRDALVKLFNANVTNANVNSAAAPIQQIFKISGQVIAIDPGTNIDGSLQLQVSNDQAPAGNLDNDWLPTNWSNFGTAVTVSAAGVQLIAASDVCFRWLRAVYTDASSGTSTGTITVQIEMQGV
jgi:hypothetical protein